VFQCHDMSTAALISRGLTVPPWFTYTDLLIDRRFNGNDASRTKQS
jgi:hypothetical protein